MNKKIKHILSTQQFLDKNIIFDIFRRAHRFEKADQKQNIPKLLENKILACMFYEPSTRTRFSFESAMLKLGGQVISTESAGLFSSAIKGETLEDSIRIVSGYADVIVLRHHTQGAAKKAAEVSTVPVINAGDGAGEHPTQALLDLYTIKKELGRMNHFKIALVGDLRYSRTVHSLIYLLSLHRPIEIHLVSPRALQLPSKYKNFLKTNKMQFYESNILNNVLAKMDILYMTRIQKERFSSPQLYQQLKNSFLLTKQSLHRLGAKAIIMHPLPRINEISKEIDADPRAAYFRQAHNGLYIRMAILNFLFDDKNIK